MPLEFAPTISSARSSACTRRVSIPSVNVTSAAPGSTGTTVSENSTSSKMPSSGPWSPTSVEAPSGATSTGRGCPASAMRARPGSSRMMPAVTNRPSSDSDSRMSFTSHRSAAGDSMRRTSARRVALAFPITVAASGPRPHTSPTAITVAPGPSTITS